jgi:carbamate kinase
VRIVIALGGNALIRRGQPATERVQRENTRIAAAALAGVVRAHDVAITHGNGPQVGLLALRQAALPDPTDVRLDVLDAETEGMIGYLLEAELAGTVPERSFATLLTLVEVDPDDPAFAAPTKPVGPQYAEPDARRLAEEHGWAIARDGTRWRRVVPSPQPRRIVELAAFDALLAAGFVVIGAGGGGVPVRRAAGRYDGVEAVVDKDATSALLARELRAELLVLATDVAFVEQGWGTPAARPIRHATPGELAGEEFAAGSMGPKVAAACAFVESTGGRAVIGALEDIPALVDGTTGTVVEPG